MCIVRGGFLAFLIMISLGVHAADFYWIGNSGASTYRTFWSDPKNWSHTSGGTPLMDEVPGADDHVIFDKHGSGEVEIDIDRLLVRNFTILELSQPITFNYISANRIGISGNIGILTTDVSFLLLQLCPSAGETVTIKSKAKIDKLDIDGEGTVGFASDLEIGELRMYRGSVKTENFTLRSSLLHIYQGTFDAEDSDLVVNTDWVLSQGAGFVGKNFHMEIAYAYGQVDGNIAGEDFQISATGAGITLNGQMSGHDYRIESNGTYLTVGSSGVMKGENIGVTMNNNQFILYGKWEAKESRVNLTHGQLYDYRPNQITSIRVQDSCLLGSDIHTDTLLVAAGAKLEFGSACTTTVDKYFEVQGREEAMTFIGCWEKSDRAILICRDKAIVNYAIIRNLENASVPVLRAVNAVDMGNNLRWEFEDLPGKKFYWKGESNDWRDLGSWYWDEAFTQPARRLPTAVDDVYLTAEQTSFFGNTSRYNACHDLIAAEGKYLNLSQTVHVFGDVELKGNGSIGSLIMFTKGKSACFIADGYSVWSIDMNDYKDPEGKDECWFDLKSDIGCQYYLLTGTLKTNHQDITSEYIYWAKGVGAREYLDIQGSEIRCPAIWIFHDSISSAGSRIVVTEVAYNREGYVYNNYRYDFTTGSPQRDFMADRGTVYIPYDTVAWLAVAGRATAESSLFAEKLELLPDCDFSLAGDTYAGKLLFGGKADSLVKIRNTRGMARLKVAATGNHQVAYCLIDSVSVEGTTVNAAQSWLYTPGCTGWQITTPESKQLYWVGGPGYWSDLSHWAFSSGDKTRATRIPMPGDRIVVDKNSGLTKEDVITLDLINQVGGDLDIQIPCRLEMGERGRKLNVSGDLNLHSGVQGQLYELWLWGKNDQENLLRLTSQLTTDMIFQKQADYRTEGVVQTGYYIVYEGKIRITDSLNLVCFRTLAADSVVLGNAVVDVADWQVAPVGQLVAKQSVIACYARNMGENEGVPGLATQPPFRVNVSMARFTTGENTLYDRVKFYGVVTTEGLTAKDFYVAPASAVVNNGTIKADSVIMLGEIQYKTSVSGGNIQPVEYAFFDGIDFYGTSVPDGKYTAWFCSGINSELTQPFSSYGVQLIKGGHLCNIDSVDLFIPHVMRDSFEWMKDNKTVPGSTDLDTLEIRDGGAYFCRVYGKLGAAVSNTFHSIHERDFQAPRLVFAGDSVLCKLDHESFNLGITAINEDSQGHLGFRWFKDGQPEAMAEGDFFNAMEEGCYRVEIYGYACQDTFPVACTRWVPDVPDPALLVALGDPARHCPGESILIGVQKVQPGIDSLWLVWTQGDLELGVHADTLRVVEDDHYTITLHNICGPAQPGITFEVAALTPPAAPWQDKIASRCGPGDVPVRLGGVKGNTVRWYDAEEKVLNTGTDTSWTYPDIQASTFRMVDVVDQDRCVSEPATIELKIDDIKVPVVEVWGDTLLCPPDELFQVEMTASTTGTQEALVYHWYRNNIEVASGENSSFMATEQGLYRVEIQGFACRNRGEETISLRILNGPPDPAWMVLKPVPVHCPGEEIRIGLEPVPAQRDSVWVRWQKEGVELPGQTDSIRVVEDGIYSVNIANRCGFSSEWKSFAVAAVTPPQAPVQKEVANRCGPGEVTVRLQGANTSDYTVIWLDEQQQTLATGKEYLFNYPEVQESGYRYVRFQDVHRCLGEIGQLQLTIFDVPVVDLGGDREVGYKHQLLLEARELPLEGTFQWSPCIRLDACDIPEPVFSAGAERENPYRLDYVTPDGCLVSDSLVIHVYVEYRFPDMLTPNGDGHNDVWKIHGLELCAETNELWIYDYTGKEVYHARPYRDDWDGKSDKGDELKPGSYIYKFTPDGDLILTGMVSLIRQ